MLRRIRTILGNWYCCAPNGGRMTCYCAEDCTCTCFACQCD
ncbi:hypothetical protein [Actinomadura litoris]|nr:hypothetical protein [Actinomadura litoris]